MSQFFPSGGQSIGVSASALFLPKNIQGCFPWGLTGLILVLSKGLSRVFFNITFQKHQFFSSQLSLYDPTLTSKHDYWKKQLWLDGVLSAKLCLCFLICCLVWSFSSKEHTAFNFMATVNICSDLEPKKIKSVTVPIVSPSICHEVMGPDAMILFFECWVLNQLFHSPLSLSWEAL